MKYTLYNHMNKKTFVVESAFEVDLDIVWASQKNMFLLGNKVTITDENGRSKTYNKTSL